MAPRSRCGWEPAYDAAVASPVGSIVMDPVLVLAVIVRAAAGLREIPTRTWPTVAVALTLYWTVAGTRRVIVPTSVVAVIEVAGAVKVTPICPADTCRLAFADDRRWPSIDPALLVASTDPASELRLILPALTCTVTGPPSESRVTVPVLSVTRTVTVRGAVIV